MQAIKSADIVISDQLVPAPILALVKKSLSKGESGLHMVPKKKEGSSDDSQSVANALVLQYLQIGRTVVRLKNGDPFVFGRGGEEAVLFRSKGFTCDIVPGITSAFAAPLLANIPVTQRGIADQILVFTGRGEKGVLPVIPTYNPKRTTIALMPVGRMRDLVDDLVEKGYPISTPVAVCEKAGWGAAKGERVTRARLDKIIEACVDRKVASPAVFVCGDVVGCLDGDIGDVDETKMVE